MIHLHNWSLVSISRRWISNQLGSERAIADVRGQFTNVYVHEHDTAQFILVLLAIGLYSANSYIMIPDGMT